MSFPVRKIKTARPANRDTLKPSVRDFNEHIIGKYSDEDLYIDTVSVRNNETSVFNQHRSQFGYTYKAHGVPMVNHFPATFNTPRASIIYPDELHRRHVIKSARLRSRLSSGKQRRFQAAGTNDPANEMEAYNSGTQLTSYPVNNSTEMVDNTRTNSHHEFIGHQSPRPRPSTTHGRYFNSSNGLYTPTTARTVSRLGRPMTANSWIGSSNQWVGAGIQIKKLTLRSKDSDMK